VVGKKKNATLEQLYSIDKYFFEKIISLEALDIANIEMNKSLCDMDKYDLIKSKAKLFYTMWFDRTKRNIFENSEEKKVSATPMFKVTSFGLIILLKNFE
jgi:hypothetical protein